ncbi:hypothetical protein [Microbacterium sp. CCH5-D1]|jgi:ABC-type transporter lipoprotein component MlaA|uniref:hypothetical protein n=1 Tax=Microbacterium sp. CCH5-D1 TaxID=1768780 RepID=UPI0018D24F81|nr:hypothetical protein [Microbacterium sp. CCH5-D1]
MMRMAGNGESESVEVQLTAGEALVLFEWLAAANESDALVVDEAQRRVLWDLESQLETKLVEPFLPGYRALVDEARNAGMRSNITSNVER